MERIHNGSVSLMAFMLAVFTISVSWYIPVQQASYSWKFLMLSVIFCIMVFVSGFVAIFSHHVLVQGDATVSKIVSYSYLSALLAGMLAPILVLIIV